MSQRLFVDATMQQKNVAKASIMLLVLAILLSMDLGAKFMTNLPTAGCMKTSIWELQNRYIKLSSSTVRRYLLT